MSRREKHGCLFIKRRRKNEENILSTAKRERWMPFQDKRSQHIDSYVDQYEQISKKYHEN